MALPLENGGFKFKKVTFAEDFEILNIPKLFTHRVPKKCLIAVTEVLGSHPELSHVDLNFDFSGCDKDVRDLAHADYRILSRDFDKLEAKMNANKSNGRPRKFGFDDDEIFIDSSKYKVFFKPKPLMPATPSKQVPR